MTVSRTTPLAELPELLRVDEAARWADVSEFTIREAARRGDLPSIRLGRLVRIPRSGLAAMVQKGGLTI